MCSLSSAKRQAGRSSPPPPASHAAVKCGQRAGGSWILDGARAVAVALRGHPIRNGRSRWRLRSLDLDRVPPPHRPRHHFVPGWMARAVEPDLLAHGGRCAAAWKSGALLPNVRSGPRILAASSDVVRQCRVRVPHGAAIMHAAHVAGYPSREGGRGTVDQRCVMCAWHALTRGNFARLGAPISAELLGCVRPCCWEISSGVR
jgi:hypothetical protein